jgi:nucleoside-diphosphate-sugar epimerase
VKILITGGSGFIAIDLIDKLLSRGDQIICLDTFVSIENLTKEKSYNGQLKSIISDITNFNDLKKIFSEYQPSKVIHLAAIVGGSSNINYPIRVLDTNVKGSLNLFEAMRLNGIKRVIHVSSEEVYGNFLTGNIKEDDPQNPYVPYGISKLSVEKFGLFHNMQFGLECINLRTSWVYGVNIKKPRPPMNFLEAALKQEPLHIDSGGDFIADYTYIDDLIDGILGALDHANHQFDVYNIASGVASTDFEVVEKIKVLLPNADISIGPGRNMFSKNIPIPDKGALNCDRAHNSFGYSAKFDIKKGFQQYINCWDKKK